MTAKARRERLVTAYFQLAIAAGVLLVWQILGSWSPKAEFLLSKPSVIWTTLVAMFGQGLLNDILVTGAEALLGTLIGTVVGSSLGLALWLSKRTANVSSPFIVVVSNFPIFALAPAAI